MKPNVSKRRESKSQPASKPSRPEQGAPIGWPSIWNWGAKLRGAARKRDIRDLHGDYSEQTGAFFG